MTEEPGVELAIAEAPSMTLFRTNDPRAVVESASLVARALKDVLDQQKLTVTIGPKQYVKVEGWQLLGSMVGVFPCEVYTRPIPEDWREQGLEREDGFEAKMEARTRGGDLVGSSNARCMRTEKRWADADSYAIASMAQTRATSKALRTALGFIVVLAGYSSTPAEEVPVEGFPDREKTASGKPRKSTAKKTPKPEDPASDETFERARLLIAADGSASAGDVAKAYRNEYGIEGPIFRTKEKADAEGGTYVEEGKLLAIVATLEALAADKGDDEVVEGEVVEGEVVA